MITDQQAYWDKAAEKKEFTTPFQVDVFKSHVSKDAVVLDVGCGYGRTLTELHQQGFKKICGIDSSQKMIEKGKKLYPHIDFKKCTTTFPFKDNTFDAVVLIAVLTCIVKDKDQKQLMGEIIRVLKPNGLLYVNDFLINRDQRNVDRYDTFKKIYGTYGVFELAEGALLRHHTKDYLFHLAKKFEPMEFETLVYNTMNHHTANGFYYLGKLKNKIYDSD
ncbi:class I SAM-dependent methyltransferase [Desulfobacula sp.]